MNILNIFWALLIAIALVGCGQRQNTMNDEHDHSNHNHSHDIETLQLTSYNNDFEVFAETTPFAVGEKCEILAHFSYLNNFKPLENGKVTANIIIGNDGIRQTLEKPEKPGIYKFELQPGIAGNGVLLFDIVADKSSSQIIIPIKIYNDAHDALHGAAHDAIVSSNGVVFTKEQSWKVDFATEKAKSEVFGQVIKTTAQILPSQGDERIIAAKASGVINLSTESMVDGKAIKAGQTLFLIESGNLADNNLSVRYNEALSEYNRAKAEYERKKELAKDKIVSESDLLKAKTDFANAEIVYNNLKNNFSDGKQTISSPINGFIKQLSVHNGEYVEAGQAILTISQNRDLLIKAEIQPKYYTHLNNIISANIRVLNSNLTYSLNDLDGKVISFGKSVNADNPLIPVTFQVKNNVNLLPGSFVEMYIKTQTNNSAITIPNEAIIEEMGSLFVFVQLTPEYFEKRPIIKGSTDGIRTEVLDGIIANERVVSKGAIFVKLAQASGTLDAHSGHVH